MLSDFVFAFFIGFVGRFIYGVLFSDFDGYKRRIVNFWIKSASRLIDLRISQDISMTWCNTGIDSS